MFRSGRARVSFPYGRAQSLRSGAETPCGQSNRWCRSPAAHSPPAYRHTGVEQGTNARNTNQKGGFSSWKSHAKHTPRLEFWNAAGNTSTRFSAGRGYAGNFITCRGSQFGLIPKHHGASRRQIRGSEQKVISSQRACRDQTGDPLLITIKMKLAHYPAHYSPLAQRLLEVHLKALGASTVTTQGYLREIR